MHLDRPTLSQMTRVLEKYPVRTADLFGSVLTESFNTDSDIDILIDFDRTKEHNWFSIYFDLKFELEALLKREVDLVVKKNFQNPYFADEINKNKVNFYTSERQKAS